MSSIQLSQHELNLLSVAVPFSQELKRLPTQEELRAKLSCRSINAKNIQHYLIESGAIKVANRLVALPTAAETKATVQYALGDTSGSLISHVLRENARLTRKAAKKKFEKEVESIQREQAIRDEIESLKELAKEELKRKIPAVKSKKDTGLMLEIAIPDLHAGKLCWSKETGGAPYDVKIAIAVFEKAIDVLLERTKHYDLSEILLCVGNDLFNSDNPEGTTTGGTAVSNDGRFHKTFSQVRTMLVRTVEKLRQITKVRVVICAGNHDSQTAYHVGDSLECFFHNDPGVLVENAPISRKYVRWGKCLIGFCHGHEGKHGDYPLLMASEKPEDWAQTVFREWHTGHYHKTQNTETHGVRVRILPALCSADDWHSLKGFVNQLRTAQAFVWSKTEGLIAEVFYNADADDPIITRREIV